MIEQLIAKLRAERNNVSLETMRLSSGDAFAIGVQIGMFRGLERGEQLIKELLDEQDRRERSR